MESETKDLTVIAKSESYQHLVEQVKATVTEAVHNSRWFLVEGYWLVGQLIREEVKLKKWSQNEAGRVLSRLSKDTRIGERTLYRALQFFDRYPSLDTVPEGKNITWHKICNKYLPTPTENEKKIIKAGVLPAKLELLHKDINATTADDVADDSVDFLITDPPYPQEYLSLWKDLAVFAKRVLKPSGFLAAYSGQYHLPRVIESLSSKLEYYWTFALMLPGGTQIVSGRSVMCGWKPILIYAKPPVEKFKRAPFDVIRSPQGEKEIHEWQQSEGGVRKLIDIFSKEGDLVVDPFAGAGTFPKVAYDMGRTALGIEIDEDTYLKAKRRLLNDSEGNERKKVTDVL